MSDDQNSQDSMTTWDDHPDFYQRMALINALIERDEDVPAKWVQWLLQQVDWDAHV